MRWIFLTLILVNSLFAAVEWSVKADKRENLNKSYLVINGGKNLVLLSEGVPLSDGEVVSGSPAKADRLCLLLGPVERETRAVKLLDVFQLEGVKTELVRQVITKAPNYWVYLAPFDSRKAAMRKLREMQVVKVDSYLITQGELANGISLGVFENIDSARRMSKRRKGQGYDVQVTELGREESEFWVAIMEEYTEGLDAKVSQIMDKVEMSFEKRQILCKSVASEK